MKLESNDKCENLGIDSLVPIRKMLINKCDHQNNTSNDDDDHPMMIDTRETLVKAEFKEKVVKKRPHPAFFQIKNLNSLKYI